MLTVSADFLNAVKAPLRQWRTRGTINFFNNQIGGTGVTPSANSTQDTTFTPLAAGHNGRTVMTRNWAIVDSSMIRAANLDGVNESLSRADNASLSTGDIDYWVCAWVNFDVLPGSGFPGIICKDSGGTNREYNLAYIAATARFQFNVWDGATTQRGAVDANALGVPVTGTWYFIIAWHDATANTVNIQVNNGTVNSAATTGATGDGTGPFHIGSIGSSNFMDGKVQCPAFGKAVPSSADRTTLYNSGTPLQYCELSSAIKTSLGLVSYWNLNEDSLGTGAVTRLDSHGSNHLTDNNTVASTTGKVQPTTPTHSIPASDLYPLEVPPAEVGWWGNEQADACGNLTGTYYRLDYTSPQTINFLSWDGDDWLGHPVDFEVQYLSGASAWTALASETGWTDPNWSKQLASNVTATALRILITEISYDSEFARLLEFGGANAVEVDSKIMGWQILKERSAENASIPVGNSSANSLTLTLDNASNLFTPTNAASPYFGQLKSDRVIDLEIELKLPDGTWEGVPVGTFYSQRWEVSLDRTACMVSALDRSKIMNSQDYETTLVMPQTKLSTMMTQLLTDFGLQSGEYRVDPTTDVLPFGWHPLQTYFQDAKDIAIAEGGAFYFDENNVAIFENRYHLSGSSSILTLTDDDGYIDLKEGWDEDLLRNYIEVECNPYISGASQIIWDNTEDRTLAGLGTETINVLYDIRETSTAQFRTNAAINVVAANITITGSVFVTVQSWTPYAYGGVLVLVNSAGTPRTVDRITITGNPLSNVGRCVERAQDVTSVAENGRKHYSLAGQRLIQSHEMALSIAQRLRDVWSDPFPPLSVDQQLRARPELQLGDRIRINSSRLNLDRQYYIQRINMTFDGTLSGNMELIDAGNFE